MLPAFCVFGGIRLGAAGIGHVIPPVFVHFPQNLELFGEIHFIPLYRRVIGGRGRSGVLVVFIRIGSRVLVGLVVARLVEALALHRQLLDRWIGL